MSAPLSDFLTPASRVARVSSSIFEIQLMKFSKTKPYIAFHHRLFALLTEVS